MPTTSQSWLCPASVTARMTALSPGASPPPVDTAMRLIGRLVSATPPSVRQTPPSGTARSPRGQRGQAVTQPGRLLRRLDHQLGRRAVQGKPGVHGVVAGSITTDLEPGAMGLEDALGLRETGSSPRAGLDDLPTKIRLLPEPTATPGRHAWGHHGGERAPEDATRARQVPTVRRPHGIIGHSLK